MLLLVHNVESTTYGRSSAWQAEHVTMLSYLGSVKKVLWHDLTAPAGWSETYLG